MEHLEDRLAPATLTVNSSADNTTDIAVLTLRDAITLVNHGGDPSSLGQATMPPGWQSQVSGSFGSNDTIRFNIPANDTGHVYYGTNGITATTATNDSSIADLQQAWPGGPAAPHSWWSIQPAFALPTISVPVVIDGYSQGKDTPQAAALNTRGIGPLSQGHQNGDGDNAVLRIELDGALGGSSSIGLTLAGGSSTVQGMAINDFDTGIDAHPLGGDVIQGNFIGTDVSGTIAKGNIALGLEITSDNNLVGGATPAARNIIAGTRDNLSTNEYGNGILIVGQGNQVIGNLIGVDASGTKALPNDTGVGLFEAGTSANTIGGTTPDSRNIIAGNARRGITIDQGAAQNYLEGNFIGTDISGTVGLGNILAGSNLNDTGVWIGYAAGNGNVIGGASYLSNGQQHIAIGTDQPADLAGYSLAGAGNLISGHQVGVADFGILISGGSGAQVYGNFIGTDVTGTSAIGNFLGIRVDSNNNAIGGAGALGNLISGNHVHQYSTGIYIDWHGPATGNVIEGNLVGTEVTGTRALPNSRGIDDFGAGTVIGSASSGTGNVISANDVHENLMLAGSGAVVQGNLIGTDRNGDTLTSGSNADGVVVESANNTIGGDGTGAGNVIAFNGANGGVWIDQGSGNSIRGNSIHDNAGPGIRLTSATNANNGQAAPVLTAVSISSSGTTVAGTLHSVPNTHFDLEFFANPATDPAQGRTFLGVLHCLPTDGNGNASFTATVAAPPDGQGSITATATNLATSDTSAFSAPFVFSSLSGIVFEDFNNDGQVDFGEQGIPGVSIHLTGTDVLGNTVNLSQTTDADGAYVFLNLAPGTYTISETQPAGYLQGIDSVGTAGGNLVGVDTFSVQLGAGVNGLNYNFGERPATGGAPQQGQTAGIGFWNNKNGQALIKALPVFTNADGSVTSVANWLAATLPHIFGAQSAYNLAGHGNADVAALFQSDFVMKGVKLDAQVLATALSVYATNATLDSSRVAAQYGFTVSGDGVGVATVNVGSNGDAFGVADNTTMSVLNLLLASDAQTVDGVLYGGNTTRRTHANNVYSAVN